VLDIGDSTGEYSIESAAMLVAPGFRVLAEIVLSVVTAGF
jgi:hypothetical protein